jgi:hypothetical protein
MTDESSTHEFLNVEDELCECFNEPAPLFVAFSESRLLARSIWSASWSPNWSSIYLPAELPADRRRFSQEKALKQDEYPLGSIFVALRDDSSTKILRCTSHHCAGFFDLHGLIGFFWHECRHVPLHGLVKTKSAYAYLHILGKRGNFQFLSDLGMSWTNSWKLTGRVVAIPSTLRWCIRDSAPLVGELRAFGASRYCAFECFSGISLEIKVCGQGCIRFQPDWLTCNLQKIYNVVFATSILECICVDFDEFSKWFGVR